MFAGLVGCAPSNPATADTQPLAMIGGCILAEPVGDVPADLYSATGLTRVDMGPFTKVLTTRGLTLAATDDASDDFMVLDGEAIEESFPNDPTLDLELQAEIIRNQYRYRSLIPVPVGEDFEPIMGHAGFEPIGATHSVCDIIMEDAPHNQVMEVVEHILHYVTDIGLHYTFPDEWGISTTSTVARAMDEAIARGWYEVSGYNDIDEPDVRHRVLVQEFAYWFISTAWDLQTDYGPNEREWTLRTPGVLADSLPELWEVYERTVTRTMAPPSRVTLDKIGPTANRG